MSRVGLLGGSFDPVHHGHLLVARALREALGLDEVRLVPAGEQPFKAGRHAAAAGDRAAMVCLAVTGEPGLACETAEVDRAGPSYTVDTLRALRERSPGTEWFLCVGADAAADLPAWHEAARIPELATVVVFRRPGAEPPPGSYRYAEVPQIDISATDVRSRVGSGRSIRYLVPEAVADYIATHRLYR
ncbi:MAG TPA: nicotinate-nucleotide adenylyltransferase [Gemmatimonadales bacterium]